MIKFSNIRLIGKKPTIMNNGIEITDLTTTVIITLTKFSK